MGAVHPVFLPGETHGKAVDGQVDVGHEGPLLDPGEPVALGTANFGNHLLDAQFHVASATLVVHHAHVL